MRLVMSASLPPRRMFLRNALTTRNGPSALTSSWARTSSRSTLSRSSSRRMPALQTSSSSTTPSSRWASAATPSSEVTSTPSSTRAPSASRAGDARRPAAITWRPRALNRLQRARPMPRLAPTTRVVRVDDELMSPSLARARHDRLGSGRRGRAMRDGVREELPQLLLRPGVAVVVGVPLLQIRRRLRLGLGGHVLHPVEALLLGEAGLAPIEHERLRRVGGVLVVGDPPALVHLGQDPPDVAIPLGGQRAVAKLYVPSLGRGQDGREERRLQGSEVGGFLAEVMAGGGPDAVDARPELDGVEVKLEDPLLGQLLFEVPDQEQLLQLARQRLVLGQEDV